MQTAGNRDGRGADRDNGDGDHRDVVPLGVDDEPGHDRRQIPHADGSACAAGDPLRDLNIAEVATLVDAMAPRMVRRLIRTAEVAVSVEQLAPVLVDRIPELGEPKVHEVARLLIQPMLPGFEELISETTDHPGLQVQSAVAALFEEWPANTVILFVELHWEVSGLRSSALDREALERVRDLLEGEPSTEWTERDD